MNKINNYKKTIKSVLNENKKNGHSFMSAVEIINYASKKGLCEPLNASRKAHSHPFFKVLSTMCLEDLTIGRAVLSGAPYNPYMYTLVANS